MDYASEIKSDLPQNRVDFRIEMAYNICLSVQGLGLSRCETGKEYDPVYLV